MFSAMSGLGESSWTCTSCETVMGWLSDEEEIELKEHFGFYNHY